MNLVEKIDTILEIFNTKVKMSKVHSTGGEIFNINFEVKGKIYESTLMIAKVKDPVFPKGQGIVSEFLFSFENAPRVDVLSNPDKHGKTGTGDQFQVFSAVVESFGKLVRKVKPDVIMFRDNSDLLDLIDGGREKLYTRFLNQIPKKFREYKHTLKRTFYWGSGTVIFVASKVKLPLERLEDILIDLQ